MRSWIEAGLGDVGDAGVTAVAIIIAIVLVVALWVTDAVALLMIRTAGPGFAIAGIKASQGVVTLRVAIFISHLADVTVGEHQAAEQRRVAHVVHAQLPGDVVHAEGLVQVLMLQMNLLVCDGGFAPKVVEHVHHAVTHRFGTPEAPEVVVVACHFCVIAHRLPAGRRLQGGVQRAQAGAGTRVRRRETAVLHREPLARRVLEGLTDDQVEQVLGVFPSVHVPDDLWLRRGLSPQTHSLHRASVVMIQSISTHHQHLSFGSDQWVTFIHFTVFEYINLREKCIEVMFVIFIKYF